MKGRFFRKLVQYAVMRNAVPLSSGDIKAFRYGNKIFANSIPKAGTNLLKRMLNLLPTVSSRWTYHLDERIPGTSRQLAALKKGQVVTAHLPWSKDLTTCLGDQKIKNIFMVRDPRDIAVSGVFYLLKDKTQPLHQYFSNLKTAEERLLSYISGVPEKFYPGGKRPKEWEQGLDRFFPWLGEENCLTVKFESLIGVDGGGSEEEQLKVVEKILAHLEVQLEEKEFIELTQKIFFPGSRTFRKGQIGAWKTNFNDNHKKIFKKINGEALVRLGYEKNLNW